MSNLQLKEKSQFFCMKVALCFLISGKHIVNKEHIWIDWIAENRDIINVYFHYKEHDKIESAWILNHAIPRKYIVPTSYLHVVDAYLSIMDYAMNHDPANQWFCMLTESCVPIVSPFRFRELFFENYHTTLMSWRKAWWSPYFHRRANLRLLKEEYRLANDPWFVMKRSDVLKCLLYRKINPNIYFTICEGGLANESVFAIMLVAQNALKDVKSVCTHAVDWSRMTSPTSPHSFKEGNQRDIQFIKSCLSKNTHILFLRKILPDFPDKIINQYISQEKNVVDLEKRKIRLFFLEWFAYLSQYKHIFLSLIFMGGIGVLLKCWVFA